MEVDAVKGEDNRENAPEATSTTTSNNTPPAKKPRYSLTVDEALSSGKKNEKRKSKRRSSFVPNRICRSFCVKNAPLCENIAQDVPSHERLEILHQKAVEHTLDRLRDEFPSLSHFEEFKTRILDAVETSVVGVRECGDFIKATTPPEKLLQDVENQRIEKQIKEAEEQIESYNTECDTWDKILNEHVEAANEAEKELKLMEDNPFLLEKPANLSKEQQAFLESQPKFPKMLSDLQTLYNKQTICLDMINRHVKMNENVFEEAERVVTEVSGQVAEASFPDLAGKSPRRLIEAVTSD